VPLRGAATDPLSPWQPGLLDIHHIATGRGDATLIVAPSGAMALIDAGAVMRDDPALVAPNLEGASTPGIAIANYVARTMRQTRRSGLDAVALSHLHDDHVTGLADVAARVPITSLLDRTWPDYGYPPFEGLAGSAYAAFARDWAARGKRIARLEVGTTGQLLADKAGFAVRTVAASGRVWTGTGDAARKVFPLRDTLPRDDWPNENACSAAFLISYGAFRYFHGGDLSDWADAGTRPWMNALSPAAKACGRVDVAVAPHHGMFDALSSETVRALRPKTWIISAWHAAHPSIDTLERMNSARLYPGPRDIYATALHPAADLAMSRLTRRFRSRRGHVVVRVSRGGDYEVFVTA